MTDEKTKDEVDNTSGMDLPWLNERQHRRHVKQNYTNTKSSQSKHKETKTVKVSDFDMPFGSMVVFMVKWAIASIPAFLILMFMSFFLVDSWQYLIEEIYAILYRMWQSNKYD